MCNTFVEELLALGVEQGSSQLCPTKYRVVRADNSYCCEIQVGFSLNLKVHIHSSFMSSFFFLDMLSVLLIDMQYSRINIALFLGMQVEEEQRGWEFGGWKQSEI